MTVKLCENVYGIVLDEYENGYETTAGFCEGKPEASDCISVTYISDHADCLPVNWAEIEWLDDNNKRQKISSIIWDKEIGPVFRMQDGSLSEGVTGNVYQRD